MRPLLSIRAENYRSLRSIHVDLAPLNVLVGPNEAGKSNFLDLIEFLGDSARFDLSTAISRRGGMGRVRFRGLDTSRGAIRIGVNAEVTTHSSDNAPDEYSLRFWSQRLRGGAAEVLLRSEEFRFKRTQGRGRRITVKGNKAELIDERGNRSRTADRIALKSDSLALSTLRRLPANEGGEEVERFARLFTTFRVFNVDVARARRGARMRQEALRPDAANLATALVNLAGDDERYDDFLNDARAMVPGLLAIEFEQLDSSSPTLTVKLIERGLRDSTYLEDASFGTVRILALLALLYDPSPPLLTCIEEIDHGLHPHLFDRLIERLREASSRTQLLIATHSPALVNRLDPSELIVVERAEDGSTRMPAASSEEIASKVAAASGRMQLGELWFSGTLGGVPR